MSNDELEYEPDNKSTLEKCCKIMDAATVSSKMKVRKVDTRRNIATIPERRELKANLELSC